MLYYLLILGAAVTGAADVNVELLDGSRQSGQLVSISAEQVQLSTPDGPQPVSVDDLLSITPITTAPVAASTNVWLELTDGSTVHATGFTAAGGKTVAPLLTGSQMEVDVRGIFNVRLKPHSTDPAGVALKKRWQEIMKLEAKGDVLVIRKEVTRQVEGSGEAGEEPRTETVQVLSYLEGVLGDVTADKVNFKLRGKNYEVDRARVEGFRYFKPITGKQPSALCQLVDAGGSSWMVRKLELSDTGDNFTAETSSGASFQLDVKYAKAMDFSMGKIKFLSDLGWIDDDKSLAELHFPSNFDNALAVRRPAKDKNLYGKPLKILDKTYGKGIALHAQSKLTFLLPEGYSRLLGVAGIDDYARNVPFGADCELIIIADGKELLRQRITGRDKEPFKIDLNIEGKRKLIIIASKGVENDIADELNLCDLKVKK